MTKTAFICVVAVGLFPRIGNANEYWQRANANIRYACASDQKTLCPGLSDKPLQTCMRMRAGEISDWCYKTIKMALDQRPKSNGTLTAAPAAPAPPPQVQPPQRSIASETPAVQSAPEQRAPTYAAPARKTPIRDTRMWGPLPSSDSGGTGVAR